MEHVAIEGITPKASRIGLGTWAMGGWMWGGTDEERSIRTICSALDRGRGGDPVRNASRIRIEKEFADSLRRFRTDYIDVYQVHWPDPLVPIAETAEALYRLYRHGRIGAIGVSNYSPDQMDVFRQVAPLHVAQPPYNLFEREAETRILP